MKFVMATIFTIAAAVAVACDCDVTCPVGYHPACAGSKKGCNCSCEKDANRAKQALLEALKAAHAPPKLQEEAAKYLGEHQAPARTTLTDPETKDQFTIFWGLPR